MIPSAFHSSNIISSFGAPEHYKICLPFAFFNSSTNLILPSVPPTFTSPSSLTLVLALYDMSTGIKLVFPNDCADREMMRLFDKELRLAEEHMQVHKLCLHLIALTHSTPMCQGTGTLSRFLNTECLDPIHESIRSRIPTCSNDGRAEPVDFNSYRSASPDSDSDMSDDEVCACPRSERN